MVHYLFFGYCLFSLHCCCLGNIKSDDKKKPTVHVLTLSGSLYRHFGTFNCSWEQLFWMFLQLAVCFIYKCTVSVLVRSLHIKEKSLHKPLAKLMLLNLLTLIEGTYSIICTCYTCPVYVWSKIVFGLKILNQFSFCFPLSQIMENRSKTKQNTKYISL